MKLSIWSSLLNISQDTTDFADIIIVDLKKPQFVSADLVTALVNGASGCDVRTTIVDGKVLMEDHEVMGLDEEKIIEDAKKIVVD